VFKQRLRTKSVPLQIYGEDDDKAAITPNLLRKFKQFMSFFAPLYIVSSLVGYYVFHYDHRDYYFSITYITTILSLLTFVWDSEVLRGFIWAIIPGFWIFWFYWFIPWLISLPNPNPLITIRLFVTHLPMFVLFVYFMILQKRGKGTKWWIVASCTGFWIIYLSLFKLIDDAIPDSILNFYHGWFPYQWPLVLLVIFASGAISVAVFYKLERNAEKNEKEPQEKNTSKSETNPPIEKQKEGSPPLPKEVSEITELKKDS